VKQLAALLGLMLCACDQGLVPEAPAPGQRDAARGVGSGDTRGDTRAPPTPGAAKDAEALGVVDSGDAHSPITSAPDSSELASDARPMPDAALGCSLALSWQAETLSSPGCISLSTAAGRRRATWDGALLTLAGSEHFEFDGQRLSRVHTCLFDAAPWRFFESLALMPEGADPCEPGATLEYHYQECRLFPPDDICIVTEHSCTITARVVLEQTDVSLDAATDFDAGSPDCLPDALTAPAGASCSKNRNCGPNHYCDRVTTADECTLQGVCSEAPDVFACPGAPEPICDCRGRPIDETLATNRCNAAARGMNVLGCEPEP